MGTMLVRAPRTAMNTAWPRKPRPLRWPANWWSCRHLWLAVAVGRVNHDAAIDPQAAHRCSEVAAEIDLGYVIGPDPSGDVEDARGDILLLVVDDMRGTAGAGAFRLFRRADRRDHSRPGPG